MADKQLNLGKVYQKFNFIGNLHIGDALEEVKVTKKDNSTLYQYGYVDIRKGVNKKGKNYTSRALKLSIKTNKNDTAYLELSDYLEEGQVRQVSARIKGQSKNTYMDYSLALDENTQKQCENWSTTKIEIGEYSHNTLSMSTFIDAICDKEKGAVIRDMINDKRVCITGNVEFSQYEKEVQTKFKITAIRNTFDKEEDKLRVDLNCIYTKNSMNFPEFESLANEEFVKIPMNFMIPVTNTKKYAEVDGKRVYQVDLLPTANSVGLDVSMFDFKDAKQKEMYLYMQNLLNIRQTLDANNNLIEVPLEDMKAYIAKFCGEIKTSQSGADLDEKDLTTQEKFYLGMKKKTLEDIKRERGIRKISNSMILVDAIPYGCEECPTDDEALHKVPETISSTQAFAQPATNATPAPNPVGGMPTGMPDFSMGMKM